MYTAADLPLPIKTPRLVLRLFTAEDVPGLHRILGDEETMRYMQPPFTPDETTTFLNSFCIKRRGALAAADVINGEILGYILLNACGEEGVFETGWAFRRDCWRQGLAFEALDALLHVALAQPWMHKIFAETADPARSGALAQKLGLLPEGVQKSHTRLPDGTWADMYLYGVTKNTYIERCR